MDQMNLTIQTIKKQPATTYRDDMKKRAQEGDAAAQYELASDYWRTGKIKKRKTFLDCCRKPARQGFANAQALLAEAYESERMGIRPNKGKALYWYRKAAAQRNPRALWALGWRYLKGDGVKQNHGKAAQLFFDAGIYNCNQ